MCHVNTNPITCDCYPVKNWSNNTGGIAGLVVNNLDTWAGVPEQTFGYVLHSMTTNSALAGMDITYSW